MSKKAKKQQNGAAVIKPTNSPGGNVTRPGAK